MTRLVILAASSGLLVGCGVALAQGAPVAAATSDPLAALLGGGGVAGAAGAAYVAREALRAASDIGGELRRATDLAGDIKTMLSEQGTTLRDLVIEQRASRTANEGNGKRLQDIESDVRLIERILDGDEPTEERRRRRAPATT